MPATGIDKAQFGNLYAQARANVLTPAAARKAFQDSGMTVDPSPEKVLRRLPGYSAAPCQHRDLQPAAQLYVDTPGTEEAFDAMLGLYKDSTDPRESRMLRRALVQAFRQAQAEVTVERAREERNRLMASRAGPSLEVGDRMILSRERMISREEAERMLREKRPAIDRHQQRDRQRRERAAAAEVAAAAADGNHEVGDDDEVLSASSSGSNPPQSLFWTLLDDGEPLSTNSDEEPSEAAYWDTIPHAGSS